MDTALQSSVYVSSPEFAGWLMKRGFHWRKLWKKRWVALHGAELVYMDKEPTIENSSSMTITKAQITTATVIDRDDLDGNPNGFAIHINDGNTPTWYLRAESAREKKSWLMRLSHVHAIVRWLEDFEKVKVLGVGGTGIVYELLHKSNGQRFAMKEMEIKNKAQMNMAISEAEMLKDIMENVSHPNIMHIEKVFQVGSKFYLVFPLCTGGELYEHIIRRGHFTERDAAIIIRDLVSGLQALHKNDILHLDIKPENILFDSMGEDARIKITDFGLSKLFNDATASQQRSKFSMALMEEKLRLFSETGDLNREKLRGTIGYMSPELILTGHCSKATDVFAAGVVLYILLCGRPPFNSKSNREVLERTARGQYAITGPEWDEVSEEAKDLVKRMLIVNPEERISTEDILSHSWLRQLDEELLEEGSSVSGSSVSSVDVSCLVSTSSLRKLSSSTSMNRKGSGLNLSNALRLLSGHVKQIRSEKLATNVTRLVSMLQQSGRAKSTLSTMFLTPADVGAAEDNTAAVQSQRQEDTESLLLSPEFREGLTAAFHNVNETDSGRLTIEQFMSILRYINAINSGPNAAANPNNPGLGPLILSRFIDRDNDGYITPDDIFAAQALIIQRSEIFLRVVFRIYTESIWYPGRQLNLLSILQQTSVKGASDGNSTSSVGTAVIHSDKNCLGTVVEPPKFITQRHVAAVFEKLGYDIANAHKVFLILVEAVSRIKLADRASISSNDEENESRGLSSIREEPDSERDRETIHNRQSFVGRTSLTLPPPPPVSTPNAALAKAFGDFDDSVSPSRSSKSAGANNRVSNNDDASASAQDTSLSAQTSAKAEPGVSGVSARMDFQDFVRAVEVDDVLLQVLILKPRNRVLSLLREAESRSRSKRENGEASSHSDMTAELLEEELKNAFSQLKVGDAPKKAFPIANAVGRATINAALGLASLSGKVASTIMEARFETVDGDDTSGSAKHRTNSTSVRRLSARSSVTNVLTSPGGDSDDEA